MASGDSTKDWVTRLHVAQARAKGAAPSKILLSSSVRLSIEGNRRSGGCWTPEAQHPYSAPRRCDNRSMLPRESQRSARDHPPKKWGLGEDSLREGRRLLQQRHDEFLSLLGAHVSSHLVQHWRQVATFIRINSCMTASRFLPSKRDSTLK